MSATLSADTVLTYCSAPLIHFTPAYKLACLTNPFTLTRGFTQH